MPLEDRIKKMVMLFQKFGVKPETIEKRLGRSIDTMTPDDLAEYGGIYNSIKDGNSGISDWFDMKSNADRAKSLTNSIMGNTKEEENNVE
jgi:hypothetical protein